MSTPFEAQTAKHTPPKSIPSAAGQTAHPPVEEAPHINADLYRTFSPSDVAMWDWRAEMKPKNGAGGLKSSGSGLWSKIFGFKSSS